MLEQQMVETIQALSEKIGVASEKLWEWALIQVQVSIYQTVGFFVLMMGLNWLFYKVTMIAYKKWNEIYSDWEFLIVLFVVILGLLVFILNVSLLCEIYNLPQYIMNPEFKAFQIIMNELGKLR